MGINGLTFILNQERQHWLLKTNKKIQTQDKTTGDMFQGVVDNIGSDILLTASKLSTKIGLSTPISFSVNKISKVIEINNSALPFNTSYSEMMIGRLKSIMYPTTDTSYNNFHIKFKNASVVKIPMSSNGTLFSFEWIATSTVPYLVLVDANDDVQEEIQLTSNMTNATYLYPLTSAIQPFNITSVSAGTYITESFRDNGAIGYPVFWFVSDQSRQGPECTVSPSEAFTLGNKSSKYSTSLIPYVNEYVPDDTTIDDCAIVCSPVEGYQFSGTSDDYSIPIGSISYQDISSETLTEITISGSDGNVITMNRVRVTNDDTESDAWENIDETTYSIPLSVFENNSEEDELIPAFNVSLDRSVKFGNTTTDTGSAGIHISSANLKSDISDKFPENLNKWEGLPEHITDEDVLPQIVTIHAVHNTPDYDGSDETKRQVAGIIVDPGKPKTYDETADENEEKGRVYIISNDEPTYVNNEIAEHKKPLLTAARICDVPTSIVQLSNIHGVAPQSIVDKEYVRTEVSFTEADKEKLYNGLADKWVKPTALDAFGHPITEQSVEHNNYIFESPALLRKVDMVNHNDFRVYKQLNPMVDASEVSVYAISDAGSGYNVNDQGLLIVGGFSYTYYVSSVDGAGHVTGVSIGYNEVDPTYINLSNFTLYNDNSGITKPYGTSPFDPDTSGSGLKLSLIIEDYDSIKTYKDGIHQGLFALVRESDGLYIYEFLLNDPDDPSCKSGRWEQNTKVADFELDDPGNSIPTTEAYMCSIIPKLMYNWVCESNNNTERLSMKTMSTASMINVLDQTLKPFYDDTHPANVVDFNKFYCNGIQYDTASSHDERGIRDRLTEIGAVIFDCYIIWKWADESSNNDFSYGIIRRSLNNLVSTDLYTQLPPNTLRWKKYVNTNQSTTVVWNVKDFGNMVWTFNPACKVHERYLIDPETRDLSMTRNPLNWSEIDIKNTGSVIHVVDPETNKLLWNIMTNNSEQSVVVPSEDDPEYQAPGLTSYPDWVVGTSVDEITHLPIGDWELVFPRINSFKLQTSTPNDVTFEATRLTCVRGSNIGDIGNVTDESGNNVNKKTMIVDETQNGIYVKLYNSETGMWDSI